MKRTLQPRDATHVRIGVRGIADAEPVQRGRRPVRTVKEQRRAAVRSAGVREMAWLDRHAEQIGEPLISSPYRTVGQRPARTKKISRREDLRVSDEVVVSEDLEGQHNPPASQGPLDWKVCGATTPISCPRGPQGWMTWTIVTYKSRCDRRMRVLRLTRRNVVKVVAEFQFEAVLGKTRRTEF
jgi:hypothetical protein